jgi:hypothetical protein
MPNPAVLESVDILGQVHTYYTKALTIGAGIGTMEPEALVLILDERARILQRTQALFSRYITLKESLEKAGLSPSEQAFLGEQKARIKDLAPKFQAQERQIATQLKKRLLSMRGDMLEHNQSANAIRQYLSAPQAKPYI